jgi:pimeloyl-ACP methyl ester carboxylesterase
MKYNFLITTSAGNQIDCDLYSTDRNESKPVVMFVHGFKGFKDWGFFPPAAGYFEGKGYHSITFNFSHNGVSPGSFEFDDLAGFAKNILSLEVDELKEISSFIISGNFCNFSGQLFIIGHSRGGGATLLASPAIKNLGAVAVWSSISYVDRYTDRQKKDWKEKGSLSFLNTRTGQEMSMNYSFLEDLLTNKEEKLSIEKSTRQLEIPVLAVHGEIDLTVPVRDSERIISFSKNQNSELFIVPRAGHTFNMVHPPVETTEQFSLVINKTDKFFRRYIRG